MEIQKKLSILADAAKYDASCASSGARRRGRKGQLGNSDGVGICHSYTPDGRCVSLLKILLTNYCIYDCKFCVNRVSNDVKRARFTPAEVVALTIDFYRRNYIEGLFLSSGIIQSPDYTMEQLIEVARRLREDHGFNGYVHLKVVPGAAPELVEAAGRWADRVSANVELPTDEDLQKLAPEKTLAQVEDTMRQIDERRREAKEERRKTRRAPRFAPAGQSTQLVVGATPTSDARILGTASRLYRSHGLKRVYYTAYSPIPGADARLPLAAPPLVREHRLYQADWLIRFYGFDAEEVTETPDADLRLDVDPKLAWALRHPQHFPVDLNRASRRWLLRVPGIGKQGADRILRIRRHHKLRADDLKKLRIPVRRALPFVVTADHLPRGRPDVHALTAAAAAETARQLELFPFADAAA